MTKEEIIIRLNEKTIIDPITNCRLWQGSLTDGYGKLWYLSRPIKIHRLSAYVYLGLDLSNPNLYALHKLECPNRHCWWFEHLYIGTVQDNIKDRDKLGHQVSVNKFKTHCKAGHEFTPENTSIRSSGARNCKTCQKERDQIRHKENYLGYGVYTKNIKDNK